MSPKYRLSLFLLIGAIAAPVITYLCFFGLKISDSHTRWAEFGSAIGGIYSPLVALLTLAVLLRQVSLQTQMNAHEFDQAYLEQARADIEFYSTQMAQVMNSIAVPGRTLRSVLHENFLPAHASSLDSEQLRGIAANIHGVIPPTFDIWDAIYPTLTGLEAGKAKMYEMTHLSSIQKLIALLSFETCVAIDNFHRVRSQGRSQVNYCFSPLLKKE